ncbi:MAG: MFS transporter [Bacteroidota bacterium]
MATSNTSASSEAPDMKLFWGCFIALIATSFGFIIRALIIGDWAAEFNLTETQKGELLGVGLWPFAISIVLFSLVIDRIGYRNAMLFGLICHVLSAVITIMAKDYWWLYIGTFICALGNGTVEAYINPVVTTLFRKDKTKWLNTLHAGWPGGLVLGGILTLMLGSSFGWQTKVGLILIPVVAYAIMLWNKKFPVQERVAAGVSYQEMLKEVGILGALIISVMVFLEIGRIFQFPAGLTWVIIFAATGAFGWVTKSLGRPMFILMLLIMMPLAITELGVDSWISDLMAGEMANMGIAGGWVLVYTSLIMMILRFFAGPIVHRLSPLGLLAACAFLAACGLFFLSKATGAMILLAATLYGVGKTFFWPTTLGVVAEQFPRGGALTLNGVAAVGMLAAGIVGGPFLGNIQDRQVDKEITAYDAANSTQLHATYVVQEKTGIFGKYLSLDHDKVAAAPETERQPIEQIQAGAKKGALQTVALFPVLMLICYVGLILYFKSKGGYKPVELDYSKT